MTYAVIKKKKLASIPTINPIYTCAGVCAYNLKRANAVKPEAANKMQNQSKKLWPRMSDTAKTDPDNPPIPIM